MVNTKVANTTRKRGIGIMEVMVAALVLGILYAAISNLQKGNREALLRIRGRDGATEVAQNIIDSLSALGLARFSNSALGVDASGNVNPLDTIRVTRSWKGQPGIKVNTMTVTYKAVVTVSDDSEYNAQDSTLYTENATDEADRRVSHVYAKRLNVTVLWPFKNTMQSISVSGVIR